MPREHYSHLIDIVVVVAAAVVVPVVLVDGHVGLLLAAAIGAFAALLLL